MTLSDQEFNDECSRRRNEKEILRIQQVKERAESLFLIYQDLIQTFNLDSSRFFLSSDLLRIAIENYWIDLDRHKEFHQIQFANGHKKAAYTLKWLSKARPIQFIADFHLSKIELKINELFAVKAALSHLNKLKINNLSVHYFDYLVYQASFRNIDAVDLSANMYLLDKGISKQYP